MSTLMLYIGIAVTFLTVWGVVMVGGYLLGEGDADEPKGAESNWGPTSAPSIGATRPHDVPLSK